MMMHMWTHADGHLDAWGCLCEHTGMHIWTNEDEYRTYEDGYMDTGGYKRSIYVYVNIYMRMNMWTHNDGYADTWGSTCGHMTIDIWIYGHIGMDMWTHRYGYVDT